MWYHAQQNHGEEGDLGVFQSFAQTLAQNLSVGGGE